jgi:uncharacterized protein YcbX
MNGAGRTHGAVFVSALSCTAIKGTRVREVQQLQLDVTGARGDRRFYVIDERDRMRNGKQIGALQAVVADFTQATGTLVLRFPDRDPVTGAIELGDDVHTRFFSRERDDRLVLGPWSDALSQFTGQALRLVATDSAVDRGASGGAALVARASLRRLAEIAQAAGADCGETESIDWRRFRMLIEADGLSAHAEDSWVGERVRVGEAVIRWEGHIGRCLVTGRDPESGVTTLPTLDLLGRYRRELDATEPLPFGIHGEVLEPGRVCVGDPIEILSP